MGKINDGIFGGFKGKVGNVVGSSWRGIEYIKSRPAKMTNPRTKGQTKQRSKFTVTQSFLRTFTPFVRIGFQNIADETKSAFNAAMSYNMLNGIKIGSEGSELDFTKVLVSIGPLYSAADINANIVKNELQFSWDPTPREDAKSDDQSMVLAFNPAKVEAVHDINAGKRSSSKAKINLPVNWKGDVIETYIAFKSADGTVVSDSVYAGQFNVDI